jgi:hypothetical protein
MERSENQTKHVLDPDQTETLVDALRLATEFAHAIGTVEQHMSNPEAAQEWKARAARFQELLTYSPEVVRVAVTIETPSLRAVQ